jgi:hypothetical protein
MFPIRIDLVEYLSLSKCLCEDLGFLLGWLLAKTKTKKKTKIN